jgi:hypothetical protein
MNSKQKLEEELYNINDYSDIELYEILDLINPSDRELEAKILFFIKKYEDIGNNSSLKIMKFFEDIYNHFFDNDDDFQENKIDDTIINKSIIENYQDMKTEVADLMENEITNENTITPTIPATPATPATPNPSGVIFTSNLEYAKDPLNPILKQTTTRIVSIDSQYREDKSSLTTDFTFELSEVLRDVVSMKLYSFQIPYTWYTIGKSFGCNFFYLKGITDGINNGNHDIQISLDPGNYTPNELAIGVRNSIKNAQSTYTDISFGRTDINYNSNTSLSTMTIEIINLYNENSYYLNFPYFTSPYKINDYRNDSIPAFLGFETSDYNTNSVKSEYILPLLTDPSKNPITTNTHDMMNQYIIDNNINNYFTIIKYIGPDEYDINKSIIDMSFNVYFSLPAPGKYSRNALLSDISNSIHNCIYLDNTSIIGSSITRKNIDPRNGIPYNPTPVNSKNNSYFELKIKPKRLTTNNINNSKIAIQFPYEDPTSIYNIWTGSSSCFCFKNTFNELNNIYSEVPLIPEPQIFTIDDKVQIYLSCVVPGFDLSINDISINIPANINPINNITFIPYSNLESYVNAINIGIKNSDALNNYCLNTNSIAGGTKAYIDDNGLFNIYLDIEKNFNESTYYMDLSNSILNSYGIQITDASNNTLITDLTQKYSTFVNVGGFSVNADTVLAEFFPDPNQKNGNQNDTKFILIFGESKYYTDYVYFESDVNNIFNNFIDPMSGRTIFAGTNLSHVTTSTGYEVTMTIKINKRLVAKNYSINFIDKNIKYNSWQSYLFIDNSMFNKVYDFDKAFSNSTYYIIYNNNGNQILSIDAINEITISGINPIIYSYLNIQKGINNIIKFIAYEDGVANSMGTNDLIIDMLKGTNRNNLAVTANDIISIINTEFNNSSFFKGSMISSYYDSNNNQFLKIRMNVNRIYTAVDYNLVFYDEFSFVRCFVGSSSVQNTTWDSTIGWILGFRNYTIYSLSDYVSSNNIATIIGDTGVCTNLYNYFLLCLDDYNQNHLNDGLITITNKDTSIPLPSYANVSNLVCDPATGQLTYNTQITTDYNKLTANQIYALSTIINNKSNTKATGKSVSTKSYGNGPYAKDVIAILPMKVAGLSNGVSYMEYGGTLQNQGRSYFGPVNIRKMAVSLLSDRGNKVDLNNANWSFSLIVETLNKLKPSK